MYSHHQPGRPVAVRRRVSNNNRKSTHVRVASLIEENVEMSKQIAEEYKKIHTSKPALREASNLAIVLRLIEESSPVLIFGCYAFQHPFVQIYYKSKNVLRVAKRTARGLDKTHEISSRFVKS